MKSETSKTEAREKIEKFFENLDEKNPEQIRKMKRVAMHYRIPLRTWKKKFCKKCYSVFNSKNSEVRIKRGMKIVRCKNCGEMNRYKIK